MSLHYPNGKKYIPTRENKTISSTARNMSYSNRGMILEDDLNETNQYYLQHGIAVIYKKPTPVQIVHVDYPQRSSAVIKEAYFKQPSTTDYNGVYQGKYIDFEAKETKNKTSFPLKNFHAHQMEHMKQVIKQDGICFVIVRFVMLEEIYLLEGKHVIAFWERMQMGGRKSIKKTEIETLGHLIPIGFHPRLDYLKIVKQKLFA
ncbi:Holliday junction resolvase RecU [Bacillus chungangensis]|uniref:Holliday junction resolvase RecU n=1 Tax=Bacillus chungangensis TaxID=587633 RepID=A0ABT9WSP5_9BACI|nr:Holliday junction resolvase RecU [Bacillus chungangensis]MDQ0176163.1 recombination protein U [Bacillus chungangensis]